MNGQASSYSANVGLNISLLDFTCEPILSSPVSSHYFVIPLICQNDCQMRRVKSLCVGQLVQEQCCSQDIEGTVIVIL